MKRAAFITLALAALSSSGVYANSFLDGMVGTWSQSVTVVVTKGREVLARETRTTTSTTTKLSDGTYYTEVFGDGQTMVGQGWLYKNRKWKSIHYTEAGLYNGEGKGTWSVGGGRLTATETAKTLDTDKMVLKTTTRRIDANTYGTSGKGTINGLIKVSSAGTSVRLQ